MPKTARLSRYIQGQLILPTLIALLLFTFVMLMNELFLLAQKVVSLDLGWELSSRLLLYQMPKLLVMTIPMGTLLGTLVAVGRLSADHEWVAMQAAGLGPSFLMRPVLLHGLLLGMISLLIYFVIFPRANYAARNLQSEIALSANIGGDLRPRIFYTDLPDTVLFVDEIRPGTRGRLEGLMIHRSNAIAGLDELILAREGDIYPSSDRSGSVEMDLRDGVVHAYRSDAPENYRVFRFGEYHVKIDPPPFLQAFRNSLTKSFLDMDLAELLSERQAARDLPDGVLRDLRMNRAWQEVNQRFALPAATVLFAILAVPLGITRVRSGKGAGFFLAIIVIAVYWVVFTSTRELGFEGHMPVALGVWIANLVMLAWIVFALLRLRYTSGRKSAFRRWLLPLGSAIGSIMVRARPAPRDEEDGEVPSRAVHAASANRLVSLVDRYIAVQFLKTLGLAMASIYVVYLIVELKDLLDGAIESRQPLSMVVAYFKYLTPEMFNLVLPVASLIGAVVTFTLLARSGELTAVLASGISLRRTVVPVILITLVLCGVFFLVQNNIAPVTNQKASQIKDQIMGRPPRTYGLSPTGRWTLGSEGRLYHYQVYDSQRQIFQGLSVFTVDRSAPAVVDHRFIADATWNGEDWVVGSGWHRKFARLGTPEPFNLNVAGETIPFDPPETFARKQRSLTGRQGFIEQMSIRQLGEQIDLLRESGYDTTRLQVDYHVKLAYPLNPLVIVLVGLPFGFRIGRRGSMYGIGVALLLVIVYWSALAVFHALGQESILPPLLAAWGPSFLFSLLGLYMILHIRT